MLIEVVEIGVNCVKYNTLQLILTIVRYFLFVRFCHLRKFVFCGYYRQWKFVFLTHLQSNKKL